MHRFFIVIAMMVVFIFSATTAPAQTPVLKTPKVPILKKPALNIKKAQIARLIIESTKLTRQSDGSANLRVAIKNVSEVTAKGWSVAIRFHKISEDSWVLGTSEDQSDIVPGRVVPVQMVFTAVAYDKARVELVLRNDNDSVLVEQQELDLAGLAPNVVSLTARSCSAGQAFVVSYQNDQAVFPGCTVTLKGRDIKRGGWTDLAKVNNVNLAMNSGEVAIECRRGKQMKWVRVLLDGPHTPMKDVLFQLTSSGYVKVK